ncbi:MULTISPECIES: helix-turn-helix domain-containing protein [unclassified Microcoleus]|uniref:helix-turn-helix domain-containing protein n=1 Tax=unclassified Microcoleus TaxID=2642155 RepID=UPI002FD1D881
MLALLTRSLAMYALKLELKLNNTERTLMARHAGYARFCYNESSYPVYGRDGYQSQPY